MQVTEDICPLELLIYKVLCFDGSAALMVACNCSITHTNVHSTPFFKTKHCISFLFIFFPPHCGPDCHRLSIAANSEWGLSDPGNRENNVIFISRDISSPPHYHSTVMNGGFCPHNHERTCHLSVSPNWLFTTFQRRQTDTFLIVPKFVIQFDTAAQIKLLFFFIYLLHNSKW